MLKDYLSKLIAVALCLFATNFLVAQSSLTIDGGDTYATSVSFFSGTTFGLNAEIVQVDDGDDMGGTTSVTDGCEPILNDVSGKIALIDRGACAFAQKAINAADAGAAGVVICNNVAGDPFSMLGNAGPDFMVPVLALDSTNCAAIKMALGAGTVTGTMNGPSPNETAASATLLTQGTHTADAMDVGFGSVFNGATHGLWYRYETTAESVLTITTCNGDAENTRLIVMPGSTGGQASDAILTGVYLFSQGACTSGLGSEVSFIVGAGESYYIHWDDANGGAGGFDFDIIESAIPMVDVSVTVDMNLVPDPSPDGAYIAGDFNGWTGEPMTDNGDGTWSHTINIQAGTPVIYKFQNGDGGWEPDAGLEDCGIDNGLGGYDRSIVPGLNGAAAPTVCFGSCDPCPAPVSCTDPDAILCDQMDDYAAGSSTGGQAAWWGTWSGTFGTDEDGIVSDDFAFSGANSFHVGGNGVQDVLLFLGNQTSGVYGLTWKMYVPAGRVGYHNIQEDEVPGVAWNYEVYFNAADASGSPTSGAGFVNTTGATFSVPEDTWFDVTHIFDLDADRMSFIVDGELVEIMDYPGNIGAVDFFSVSGDHSAYWDDILYKRFEGCGTDAIICDNYEMYPDGATTGGLSPWWTTWSGAWGTAEDGIVSSEQAYSGNVSMLIAEGQAQDVLLLLGNRTEGSYRLSWQMYVQSGKTGYFNIQEDEVAGVGWNHESWFNRDQAGSMSPGMGQTVNGAVFDHPQDAWFECAYVVDLDGDRLAFMVDGILVETIDFPGALGAIDFFSVDADNRYWIDDVNFSSIPACGNTDALICDNIEFYEPGSTSGGSGAAWWATWGGGTGGADDGIISTDYAASGANSVLIAEAQTQDVLLLLGNQTTGSYSLSWDYYIPTDRVAYWNIQEDEAPGVAWNLDVHFGNDTGGATAVFGEGVVSQTGTTFTYPEDQWFNITMTFDLDADVMSLWIDGVQIETDVAYTGSLGSINFFSINDDNRYYIDNVLYEASSVPTIAVTFGVDLTGYLAAGGTLETVKIAGNFADNGAIGVPNWDPPSSPVFADQGDDVWTTTIEFPASSAGGNLEFKFLNTADTWGDCGVEQECMEDGADDECKASGSDNRLLVIPGADDEICFTWETCVGCNETATREQLIDIPMTIAPNPFSQEAIVTFATPMVEANGRLTSVTGQVARTYQITGTQLIIEKEELNPGVYFFTVTTADGVSTAQKLIVQ